MEKSYNHCINAFYQTSTFTRILCQIDKRASKFPPVIVKLKKDKSHHQFTLINKVPKAPYFMHGSECVRILKPFVEGLIATDLFLTIKKSYVFFVVVVCFET